MKITERHVCKRVQHSGPDESRQKKVICRRVLSWFMFARAKY